MRRWGRRCTYMGGGVEFDAARFRSNFVGIFDYFKIYNIFNTRELHDVYDICICENLPVQVKTSNIAKMISKIICKISNE